MTLDRILPFTKYLLEKTIAEGDVVVDATCGNGNDTVFLSHLVASNGRVFAFDVQKEAIDRADQRLKEARIENVNLILDGHENVRKYIDAEISAAIFNLGYLPGGDKRVTTNGDTTWKAVVDLLSLLSVGGIIILVIYHGHEEGKVERDWIEKQVQTLDAGVTSVLRYEFLNKSNAPYIIAIEKIRKFTNYN
jgi:16S rRNA C1402 N4-methylase RsmH